MTASPSSIVLKGHGAQQVIRAPSVTLDGMVLQLAAPLAEGQWLLLEVQHPRLPQPLSAQIRVGWCRAIANDPSPYAGVEFVGTWAELIHLRRSLARLVGRRVLLGEQEIGHVVIDGSGTTCFSTQTATQALVIADGQGGFLVRRPDGAATCASLGDALASAFRLDRPPRLDPPLDLGPVSTPATASPESRPASALSEDEILGANTLVMTPDRIEEEDAILGANTIVLTDSGRRHQTAILGADGKPAESGRIKRKASSRVVDVGPETVVGFVCKGTVEASFELYNPQGKKVGVVAPGDSEGFRVVLMGASPEDSLQFLQASSCLGAVAAAFELEQMPRIEPPLDGLT